MDWTWMNDLEGVFNHFVRPWAVFGAILGIPAIIFLVLAVSDERARLAELAEDEAADAAKG